MPQTSDKGCHNGTIGDAEYCTPECRCGIGEGDCTNPNDCEEGLNCDQQQGTDRIRQGSFDRCAVKAGDGWVYDLSIVPKEDYRMSRMSNYGQLNNNGKIIINGHPGFCSKEHPCDEGQGDCDDDSECKEGYTCVIDLGAKNEYSKRILGAAKPWVTDICKKSPILLNYTKEKIPLILVHGHTVGEKEAYKKTIEFTETNEYETFDNFVKNLNDDGIAIDKGFVISELPEDEICKYGQWPKQIVLRTTYYTYFEEGYGIKINDEDSISEYAKRLGKIIEIVKKCTGSEKINIVAHSMGGLVSREYVRQRNEQGLPTDVDTLITVGSPHQGIEGSVRKNCGGSVLNKFINYLGKWGRVTRVKECDEMTKGSDFLRQLNSNIPLGINYYTIIGVGQGDVDPLGVCDNVYHANDGVVCAKDAYFEGATKYEVEGIRIKPVLNHLHGRLIDPSSEAGEKTYNLIKSILLNGKNNN